MRLHNGYVVVIFFTSGYLVFCFVFGYGNAEMSLRAGCRLISLSEKELTTSSIALENKDKG